MMERELLTLADAEVINILQSVENVLLRIDMLIEWDKINDILLTTDFRNSSHYGRDSYSPITMFRVMLIQSIYRLSDREVEFHLKVNLLYKYFCKLHLSSPVPDHSTVNRWRERFCEFGIYQQVFDEFNKQLYEKGYDIHEATIIDATLIKSQARPRKTETIVTEPVGDESLPEETSTSEKSSDNTVRKITKESKDPDARWVKKGKVSTYGYKETTATNADGFISAIITTPASVSDYQIFEECLTKSNPNPDTPVYADKGYDSEKNRDILKSLKLIDKIMRKKKKNEVRDEERITRNKAISKIRYVVERTYGYMKLKLGLARSKYIGLEKTHNNNLLIGVAYNMIRSVNYLVPV
jgi:IS5 family transposase